MRSNASFEVRMSHAVHKKRILERLSTSKMERFAEAGANGLTKTKLSRSCNQKLTLSIPYNPVPPALPLAFTLALP